MRDNPVKATLASGGRAVGAMIFGHRLGAQSAPRSSQNAAEIVGEAAITQRDRSGSVLGSEAGVRPLLVGQFLGIVDGADQSGQAAVDLVQGRRGAFHQDGILLGH